MTENGERGPQGDHGQAGDPGHSGQTGERGPQGDVGQAGTTGLPGAEGRAGQTGQAGDSGLVGERGPMGDHGQAGDTGPTGLQGAIGQTGSVGSTGPTGHMGERGLPGTDGSDAILNRTQVLWLFGFIVVVFLGMAFLIQRQQSELRDFVRAGNERIYSDCLIRQVNVVQTNKSWDQLATIERHNTFIDDKLRVERLAVYESSKLTMPVCERR